MRQERELAQRIAELELRIAGVNSQPEGLRMPRNLSPTELDRMLASCSAVASRVAGGIPVARRSPCEGGCLPCRIAKNPGQDARGHLEAATSQARSLSFGAFGLTPGPHLTPRKPLPRVLALLETMMKSFT